MTLNHRQFSHIYDRLDIGWDDLDCVMLDFQPMHFLDVSEADLFYSPTQRFAQGQVGNKAHVTLLYGLLRGIQQSDVDEVLDGWKPEPIVLDEIAVFPSYVPGEEYSCLVAKPNEESYENLLEAHSRLSFLPHINTFTEYKPHLTLMYVKKEATERVIEQIIGSVIGMNLDPWELNYGDVPVGFTSSLDNETKFA